MEKTKNPLICDEKPGPEALQAMRERGGSWAAYQNHEIGHYDCGHLQFLKVGAGCTYQEPPSTMPDTKERIGWRYVWVGMVDLEKGVIV